MNADGTQQQQQWLAGVDARVCDGSTRYHSKLGMRRLEAELGKLRTLSSSPFVQIFGKIYGYLPLTATEGGGGRVVVLPVALDGGFWGQIKCIGHISVPLPFCIAIDGQEVFQPTLTLMVPQGAYVGHHLSSCRWAVAPVIAGAHGGFQQGDDYWVSRTLFSLANG
jgi:hypothetical protein